MGLQCFLFTSDEAIAGTIRLVLAGLDVQGEFCSEAVTAAERIANQSFQIVIIDWDKQPEAGLLLTTARQRKAAERPITLAIVSDDASVPKALQAGANSILRKPIVVNQAKDTLMTARDLLRSKREPGQPAPPKQAAAAAAGESLSSLRANMEHGKEKTLRAGEFLQSAAPTPGGSFETEADLSASMHEPASEPVDPLQELEPVAASVTEKKPAGAVAPPPSNPADEPRGLEWHLKNRGIIRQPLIVQNSAAAAPAPASEKPELLGFEPSASQPAAGANLESIVPPSSVNPASPGDEKEGKKEAELFAYIEGDEAEKEETPKRSFRLGKGTIGIAIALALGAVAAAPQMPWHAKTQAAWGRGQRALHAWLYPQPVTPAQAPAAHENFARAGDEYKLPAAEVIPDATTDPSQIQVLPVVDPTKKPAADANQAQQADGSAVSPTDQPQTPSNQTLEVQTSPAAAEPVASEPGVAQTGAPVVVSAPISNAPVHTDAPTPLAPAISTPVATSAPAAKTQSVRAPSVPDNIPSSLKSQLAPNTPDPTGPKSPDTSLPSIEPVAVAEGAERALLIVQPTIAYPPNIKGQQGTVVLQVLIGRDGTVQDAKFLQGSLAFARAAIDGVKQWKFKPYVMNGRPVSVQSLLSLTFKPRP
ncbi:MAG TPA: TonB family protein [Candidatus Sulfotelmatobacter sp.]|jgi:protein TonB